MSSYLNNVEILAAIEELKANSVSKTALLDAIQEVKDAMVSKTALLDVLSTIASNTQPC